MLGRLDKFLRNDPNRARILDECPTIPPTGEVTGSSWQPARKKGRLRLLLDRFFAGLSTLSVTMSTGFNWTAQNNLTGIAYTPITNTGNITKTYKLSTASANNVSGGADEVFSFQQGIVAGGTADVDLNALTNLLNQTSVAVARVKGFQLRLLSAADDSTISPAPTATSTMTVTNNGPAAPSQLWYGNGGAGATVDLTVVANAVTAVAANQGGAGYPKSLGFLATPQTANGSGNVFFATANAGGVITTCTFIAGQGGALYGGSNLPNTPFVPVGQKNIYTGGVATYFDVSAAGFLLISANARKFRIINMDQSNAVTAEIDAVSATT